jgi:hypothetical protein
MLKKLSVAIALTIWFGCATKESAPAQLAAPATAAPSTIKQKKPTGRQLMPKLKMKVAPAGLVKPAHQTRPQYKMMLPRPTKSAI